MADIYSLAEHGGFDRAAPLCMDALIPRQEVREMCASGRCRRYDHCWSCPPACGSLEHTARQMASYRRGVLVQTIGRLRDAFDYEGIEATQQRHKSAFAALARQARFLCPDCLPLTAGSCTLCHKCTWPDRPCRFPQKRLSSMEAYGLLVSDVCLRSGLQYNYGPDTICFTSCLLFEKESSCHAKPERDLS